MDVRLGGETGGRCEQLSSLALRCAERLRVPFRDFYRELIIPILYEGRTVPKGRGLPMNSTVDGMLESAELWVRAMNTVMARSDLRRATLLPWRDTFAPRALAKRFRAWCPQCLHDFLTDGAIVYEPLAWRVAEVAVCPHHRVLLEFECPFCGRGRQPSFGAYTRVGCCRRCGKWLGRDVAPQVSMSDEDQEMFCARSVEEILALSDVEHEVNPIASDIAVRAIRDVFYDGSSAQMARALGVLPSQIVHFAAGTFPAPLHLFVRASYTTGATMEQMFLTNDFDGESPVKKEYEYEIRRSVPQRVQMSRDLVERLGEALEGDGSKSIQHIADSLHITATTVWRRERELATRLARQHAAYAVKERQRQKDQYRSNVVAFLIACRDQGVSPGRRRIDEECGGAGRFASDWKRSVIRQARAEVFGLFPDAWDDTDEAGLGQVS
ncbi:TniQ family protein [Paraburkholderia sediminicola]|uniref:TniQ family protein n=1 Tax=Paraburkholderia sediminicola TaxID=458836 RepID=UPI0038B88600